MTSSLGNDIVSFSSGEVFHLGNAIQCLLDTMSADLPDGTAVAIIFPFPQRGCDGWALDLSRRPLTSASLPATARSGRVPHRGTTTRGMRFMATLNKTEIKKLRKKRQRLKKKLRCRFCPQGCDKPPRPIFVDYKDLKTLRSVIDREGNLLSRRNTGCCAKYQRAVRDAVIRARYMGLLPYVAEE